MATIEPKNEYGYPDGPTTEPDFLHVSKGVKSWMLTLDHKRIGMMYLFGILGSLIVGGAFALLVRTELWAPGKTIVGQDTYNAFFTLHGAVMVFLVIIPGHPGRARQHHDADPARRARRRVPAAQPASFYLWCSGALLLVGAIPFGGLDTGWTCTRRTRSRPRRRS
jgi:Heme/copper-type cytochrome/quinol oxidases, subunit 1